MNATAIQKCIFYPLHILILEGPTKHSFNQFFVFHLYFNVVLGFTATFGNGVIITAILRSQNLQTPSYLLITSLAFADLLVGLICHPLQVTMSILYLDGQRRLLYDTYEMYTFSLSFLGAISFAMVTCISVDRYLALRLRQRYRILVTRRRVRILIISVWILIFSLILTDFISCIFVFNSNLTLFYVLTNCIFYIKSFGALVNHAVQVNDQQPNSLQINFDVAKYKKSLKTMLIIFASFVLCLTPFVVFFILRTSALSVVVVGGENLLMFLLVAIDFLLLNSSLNPVIYLFRFTDVRNACKQLLRKNNNVQAE